ncbi:undecaprenyl-diphosphatase UppP [candidate division WOR-1 bacterium RIFOXYC2_FULL_37_10]|uniref:Undecaprenyl-diphosphatase n=1 Tax=candidate division WOR-1 bacterium RIFOXYB2_FULL_37_13 TaxID=1802579 RepID=A0A1F4SPJ1_UNCSA|nr:MAG: undecaprenyl-diphosphatase UppP [candidate division WOR-1 bacterium RIFOXYA2_FULL_37_7]OGC22364.1 MAG: undecaprenyl-diphosphatase UppP [candidate division WOR-1 bacterium RIFOXYB2_FULL_37_13]OGC35802.1 MAG: undecaprenyl-diphosphatase UppP [candidate division WOR-1 bacterium RIFOXYC2_FULL_37_10]
MDILHSIIIGIVEGITEFLPISSTAHMVLAAKVLNIAQSDFVKSFEIIIQFGAILSVLVLYWRRFLVDSESLKRVLAAFIPTAILGFALYKFIKGYLISNETIIVWSLLLGGIILIIFELFHKESDTAVEDISKIPYSKCITIGLFQSLAMFPGVSRSAATIIGGLTLGLKRKTIVEFSFLLAVPTMLAASVLDILKTGSSFTVNQVGVLAVGFVVSFVVALLSIKFLLRYIEKHSFIPFGVYRIIIALIFMFGLFR